MASMQYTYADLKNRVSRFLGTYGSSGPTGTDLTDVEDYVRSGYLKFLMRYDWTFRRKYTSLSTQTGQNVYSLPPDYGGMRTPFQFTEPTAYPPMEERAESELAELQSLGQFNSYPQYYAIRAGAYQPQVGQLYEVMMWPTPNAELTMYYSYYWMPPKLENDTDVPVGGTEHTETVLKFCLAAAEEEADEVNGVQTQAAERELANSIRIDKMREPRTLGDMNYGRGTTAWEIAREGGRINRVSYNL
jgi:hypothetical protein